MGWVTLIISWNAVKGGSKKALIVMATGLGKTVAAAFLTKKLMSGNRGEKVLYLCHQNDILTQARTTFEAVIDGDTKRYGYFHGDAKHRNAQYLFASFQTMRQQLTDFGQDEFDRIIIDESHHSSADTYQPVVEYFKPKLLLGITATPDRADMKDIRNLFGEEVFSFPLERALAQKFLTKVDYRLVTDEIVDLKKIENPYRLSISELNKKIFVPKRDKEVAKIISEKTADISDPRMIIFCNSIKHAELLHTYIPHSLPVHSNLSFREQASRIQSFRDGMVNTIITIDKFNEGIDIPETNVVVFLRSTSSRTIFYQQLGRGLRKVDGKDKVLVLDFVANCERIEMVSDLVGKIKQECENMGDIDRDALTDESEDHLVIDAGEFNFTETSKDILNILRMINGGYTREALIEQLQTEGKRLGKSPSAANIAESSRDGRTASFSVFQRIFGSFNDALSVAGLSVNQGRYSKRELIAQLKSEAKRLGKSPKVSDINEASKEKRTAEAGSFFNAFGSFNNALSAAGLSVNQGRYSKRELIAQLKSEAKRLGEVPTRTGIEKSSKEGRTASRYTFCNAFGSLSNALEAAGLK